MLKYNQKTTYDLIRELEENDIRVKPLEAYKNSKEKIWFQCLDFEEHKFQMIPDNLLHKVKRCPLCGNRIGGENLRKAKTNENNLFANVRPEYVDYLVNKEDAYEYSYGSNRKVNWKCFDCNNTYLKSFTEVSTDGLSCPYCSKWKSYPNNFMKCILNQLKVSYIPEYSPDWITPKRYDFYFESNDKKYIVEMDGAFHFTEKQKSDLTLEEIQSIDQYKTEQALSHGIYVIRINCNYYGLSNRKTYIQNNLINSELKDILDFSTVNFDEANIYAITPNFKKICELWDNGLHNISTIADEVKVAYATALRCLKYGEEIGICTFSTAERKEYQRAKARETSLTYRTMPVMCNETREIFISIAEASRTYNCNVYSYFHQKNRLSAGCLSDGTKLTWTKISKEQYNKIIKSRAS